MVDYIVLITVVLLAALCGLFAYIFVIRDRFSARLSRDIKYVEQKTGDLRQRLDLVEEHATSYMNSLGKKGSRNLLEIKRMLSGIDELMTSVNSLMETSDPGALEQAEMLIKGEHPTQLQIQQLGDGTKSKLYSLPTNWEARLEGLLQAIGHDVSRASQVARVSGISKPLRRKSTLLDLFRAGITVGENDSAEH